MTETDSFQAPQEYLLNKTHKGAQPKCNFIPTLHPLKSQTALQSRQCLSWYQLYVFDFLIKTSPLLTARELALKKRAKGQLEGKSVWHFPKGLLLQLQRWPCVFFWSYTRRSALKSKHKKAYTEYLPSFT